MAGAAGRILPPEVVVFVCMPPAVESVNVWDDEVEEKERRRVSTPVRLATDWKAER